MCLYSQTLPSLLPLVFDQSLFSCHLMSSTALLIPHILHLSSSSSYSPPSSTFPSSSFLISLFYLTSHHLSPLLPSTQLSFLFLLSSAPPPSFDLTLLFHTATPPPFSPLPPLLFFVISQQHSPFLFSLTVPYHHHADFLTSLFSPISFSSCIPIFSPITSLSPSPCLTFSPHTSSLSFLIPPPVTSCPALSSCPSLLPSNSHSSPSFVYDSGRATELPPCAPPPPILSLFQLTARLPQPKLFSCNCSKPNNYSLSERINFLISHKDV